MTLKRILICSGLLLGLCGQAQAGAVIAFPDFGSVVQGSSGTAGCSVASACFFNLSQTQAVSGSSLSSSSSASGTASLASGDVSATVFASDSPTFNGTQSHALVWDTVTFSGAKAGAMATLTISGTATVSPPLPVTGDTARANASVILMDENLFNIGVNYFLLGNASTPESGNYSLSTTVGINNGDRYLLLVYVDAYAGLSGGPFPGGSATINDPFQLDLPDGVTASFASAVPEPATWVMLLLGFAGLGFMTFRRSVRSSAIA